MKWLPKFNKEIFLKFLKPQPQVPTPGPAVRLACDFGRSKIVFLEIEKTPQGVKLIKFQKTSRPPDPAQDAPNLKQFFESDAYSTNRVRISVKGQGVITRFVQFPQMKAADLKAAISFEVDQYIPFKSHEVVWDFHILEENISGTNGMMMNVLLAAIKRDELNETIRLFQNSGLQIELVDIDALATVNALEYFHPDRFKEPLSTLDIGTEVSTLTIIQNGKPRFIRDISYGGADLLKRLKRKLGISHEEALHQIEVDQAPKPEAAVILKEGLTELVSELQLSFNYYLDQFQSAEPVKTMFVGGGGGYHPIVLETLHAELGFTVETIEILSKIQLGPDLDAQFVQKNQGLLPVSLGLAVREI